MSNEPPLPSWLAGWLVGWLVVSLTLLCLGHGDGGSLGVIKTVHGAQLHDHVQAVGEDEHHEQGGQQAHPDAWCEEACTVTGIRELLPGHVEALDL